jgi:hypothetical protein
VQYIEVEKKFALPDPTALKAKLAELGAKPSEPTRQVDVYYNAPHRDFTAPKPSPNGSDSAPKTAAPRSTTSAGTPSTLWSSPTPTSTKPGSLTWRPSAGCWQPSTSSH